MDPAAIAAVATAAVHLVSPYLQEAAKGFAKKTGEEAGSGVIAQAKQVYETIHTKLHGTPAQEALDDLHGAPDEADLQAALRVQLTKLLKADPAFAAQLAELVNEARESRTGAVFHTNISGNVGKVANIGKVEGDVSF